MATAEDRPGEGGDPSAASQTPPVRRRGLDLALLVSGVVVLGLSALFVDARHVGGLEEAVFRWVNDLPGLLYLPLWPVMQLGSLVIVPSAAVVAAATRRFRLALGLFVAGMVSYYLAKEVKSFVVRARPGQILDSVTTRGDVPPALGYVSGHAAVVVTLATVASPYLGRRMRIGVWAVTAVVCLARLYVGAHLPLDVLGGAALGVAVGAAVHLALGLPSKTATRVTV